MITNKFRTEPDGTARVHNVRFYTIKPRAIISLAYSNKLKCLAASREDGSIELWDMEYAPYLDRVIQLTPDAQVESLAWASERLFSVDLTGKLIEWDLKELKPRYVQSPTGNALWCLDINRSETEIAIGSEEGHINIMSIEHDEISYKTLFNKQKGRVLCCKFDKRGERLVTGSVGVVRIWSVARGNILHTMTLSAKDVIVYSLQVLSDNTIIAGDSAGFVTVWDGSNATQIESSKVLDRNVFALGINEDEDRLVCSGMEPPLIRVLSKTQIKREDTVCERWIKFLQREVHTHYVKSLVVIDDRVVSGGEDGLLCISSVSKSSCYVAKLAPFLQGPCVSLAPVGSLLLLRYPQSLDLWRLGQPKHGESRGISFDGICEDLLLAKTPEKLLQLQVGTSKIIQAAAISPDSKYICYSTATEVRLNRLQLEPLQVKRQTVYMFEDQPASFITFTKEGVLIMFHPNNLQLNGSTILEDTVELLFSLNLGDHIKASVTKVAVSPCGKYAAVATTDHIVSVWKLRGDFSKFILSLPRYTAGITALALADGRPCLIVAYADGRLVEYDLMNRCFASETDEEFMAHSNMHCIKGIVLDPFNPYIVIIYNEVHLCFLEINHRRYIAQSPTHHKAKRPSQGNSVDGTSRLKGFGLKLRLGRQHLAEVCRLSSSELVTVGIQTKNLLAPLPPPFQRKKFGAA